MTTSDTTEDTTEDTAAPAVMTGQEVADSLTGWDELAIKKANGGLSVDYLSDEKTGDSILLLRCLGAVVVARRDKVKIEVAYPTVMAMPQSELKSLFGEEPDDVMPDDPDSEVGKDSSLPAAQPLASPSSASSPELLPPSTPHSPA